MAKLTMELGAGFAAIVVLYVASLVINRLFLSPITSFPGPKLAAVTFWYEFYYDVIKRGRYYREIERMHKVYGPVVRINPYELHVNDPEFYPVLYSGPTGKRDKWSWAARMFGNNTSAFSTVGHEHHRVRRAALNPIFSKASISRIEPMIQSNMKKLCGRLDELSSNGKPFDIGLAFAVFAADVISTYCFGESFDLLSDPDFAPEWVDTVAAPSELGHLVKQCPWLLPLLRPVPRSLVRRFAPSIDRLYTIQEWMSMKVQGLIEKEVKVDSESCVFNLLLHGSLPAQEKTVARLKGEGQTLIGAGTLTTANVLKTVVFHVQDNPCILQELLLELEHAFPDSDAPITLKALEKLPMLTACITEGLRLAYGVPHRLQLIARNGILRYEGVDIPSGTPVSMSSIFMHDNPEVFPDPRAFQPGRWLDVEARKTLSHHYVPFSKGTRMCLGMHLAWAEIYIVLGTLFRRYALSLFETSREDIEMEHDFFDPSPKLDSNGLRIQVTRRT